MTGSWNESQPNPTKYIRRTSTVDAVLLFSFSNPHDVVLSVSSVAACRQLPYTRFGTKLCTRDEKYIYRGGEKIEERKKAKRNSHRSTITRLIGSKRDVVMGFVWRPDAKKCAQRGWGQGEPARSKE